VYLSAAGNGGNLAHANSSVWEGDFALSATTRAVVNTLEMQTTPLHDFTSGQNYDAITADPTGYITLEWSDPRSASNNDYDLFLLDSTLSNVVSASANSQLGTQPPFEYIDSTTSVDTNNRLVVARFSGEARFLRVNLNSGGKLALGTAGQIAGHAAGTNALAVAAVNVGTASGGAFVGGSTNPVEYFSADGPRRVFFLADDTPITPGNFLATGGTLRQKPDIAAADRVSTSTPGFKPFAGTSAAAPHAAAITALLWQQHPTYTVAQIKALLTSTALDIEATGFDKTAGNGLVMADRATAGCGVLSDGAACDDGNLCTTDDACSGGACVGGGSLSCNDGNACTDDSCSPATGCVHANNTASCSDGDPCTVSESCHSGVCGGGSAKTCTASDACHIAGTCSTGVGCSNPSAPDGTSCSGGSCVGGTCVPAGSGGTGGAGSGGTAGHGGGTAGRGTGGSSGTGTGGSTGGDAGALGDAGQGGEAGATSSSGGTAAVSAGGTAGVPAAAGGAPAGGAPASGGEPNRAGGAGGPSNGGYAGSLPNAGTSGKGSISAGNGGQPPSTTLQNLDKSPIKGGCSCSVPATSHDAPWLAAAGGLALVAAGRRRSLRRRR
jgi:MYXO-CTERM domain-containing protein